MEAKELREQPTEALVELAATLRKQLFGHRMKNHTGQLEDTSLLGKTRKDIARIELILSERAAAAAVEATAGGSES